MTPEPQTELKQQERVKELVLEGARLLREGVAEKVVLAELQRGVIHHKSAQLLLNKAKELAEKKPAITPPADAGHKTKFSKVIEKWQQGEHSLESCIQAVFENDELLTELIQIRKSLTEQEHNRQQKLLTAGLPMDLVDSRFPNHLIEQPQLTLPDKLGIKRVAMMIHLGLMKGQCAEEVAIRLAYIFQLDLASTRRLVNYISLHANPELQNTEQPKQRGELLMVFALSLPFLLVLLIKNVAKTINVEMIAVFIAVTALLMFPLLRRYMGNKAIKHRRENAPDGLITLAHDDRAPILYLRSHMVDGTGKASDSYMSHFLNFTDMKTTEEKLSHVFADEGPVVALEGPAEGMPNLGAVRVDIKDVERLGWQELVLGLIARAALVVVRFRPTQGALWEVEQLIHLCPPHQLVFILATPEDSLAERDATWTALRKALLTQIKFGLPEKLGQYDCCLAFNTQFQPQIFSAEGSIFGKYSTFLDAVIEASAFSNPLFDEHKAKMRAATIL